MKYIKGFLYYSWKLYVGFVFVITLIAFYPILFVLLQFEKLRKHSFKINVIWSRCMRMLCFYAVEKTSYNKSKGGTFIIVANHTSYLDIFLLYSILPKNRFLFMGKSELLKYPLVKTFFKKLNIAVERSSTIKSAKAFIRARKELKEDWSIVIFPEGGIITPTPELTEFKNGAFQLAKSSNCAVLPITFQNNYYLFSDPSCFFLSAMPGLVKVKIHNKISEKEVTEKSVEEISSKAYKIINSGLLTV